MFHFTEVLHAASNQPKVINTSLQARQHLGIFLNRTWHLQSYNSIITAMLPGKMAEVHNLMFERYIYIQPVNTFPSTDRNTHLNNYQYHLPKEDTNMKLVYRQLEQFIQLFIIQGTYYCSTSMGRTE